MSKYKRCRKCAAPPILAIRSSGKVYPYCVKCHKEAAAEARIGPPTKAYFDYYNRLISESVVI